MEAHLRQAMLEVLQLHCSLATILLLVVIL